MALTYRLFPQKKAPPQTSDRILIADLNKGAVNVGFWWNASTWDSWPQGGKQGSGWGSIKLRKILLMGIWNPACDDFTGSNQIEKEQVHVSPRPA